MNDTTRDRAPSIAPGSRSPLLWKKIRTAPRWAVIVAALVLLALLAWLLTPSKAARAPPGGRFAMGGPMPVVVASAHTGDMPITLIGLGTVTPLATVTVQSQISGQIVRIAFKEGQRVKAGDPLIQMDPRPY